MYLAASITQRGDHRFGAPSRGCAHIAHGGMGFQNPNKPMPRGIRKNHPTRIRKFSQIETGNP